MAFRALASGRELMHLASWACRIKYLETPDETRLLMLILKRPFSSGVEKYSL
jgi:hypothetical protein